MRYQDDYYTDHLDIRKEAELYIIDEYIMGKRGERNAQSILSGKLKDGSIEANSASAGRIDLSGQTNKLYFGGSEYTKE